MSNNLAILWHVLTKYFCCVIKYSLIMYMIKSMWLRNTIFGERKSIINPYMWNLTAINFYSYHIFCNCTTDKWCNYYNESWLVLPIIHKKLNKAKNSTWTINTAQTMSRITLSCTRKISSWKEHNKTILRPYEEGMKGKWKEK